MVSPYSTWLKRALWELKPRAVAMLFTQNDRKILKLLKPIAV